MSDPSLDASTSQYGLDVIAMEYNSITALARRLVENLKIGSSADFFAAKDFFELTVAAAPIDGSLPKDAEELQGFRLAQAALFHLRSHRANLTSNGVLWRGRPDFLTDDLLGEIQREYAARRAAAVHDRWGQYLGEAGIVVQRLLESADLYYLVQSHVGELGPRRKASCIFYDEVGAYIRPHVDTDNYSVNANLLVDHVGYGEQRSTLVVYPLDGEPEVVPLNPGDLVLFYADCVVHSRTPIGKNERVWVASLGFQAVGEFHQ